MLGINNLNCKLFLGRDRYGPTNPFAIMLSPYHAMCQPSNPPTCPPTCHPARRSPPTCQPYIVKHFNCIRRIRNRQGFLGRASPWGTRHTPNAAPIVSKVSWIFLLFCLILSANTHAQYQYVKPRFSVPGYSLNIEITSPAELEWIANKLDQFQQVQRIRVAAEVDIARVAHVLSRLDNVDEVVLQQYNGILSDEDLSQLEWLHSLVLYIPSGKEDALLMNKNWAFIPGITLVFDVVPDQYDFFKGWKACKRLNLVAPFNEKEAQVAIDAVALQFPSIQEFGISLDRIYHLPESLKRLGLLQRLNIIDNASWMAQRDITALGDVVMKVGFYKAVQNPTKGNGFTTGDISPLMLHYLSQDPNLLASEKQFLASYFSVVSPAEETGFTDPLAEKVNDFAIPQPILSLQTKAQFPVPITAPLIRDYSDGWYEFYATNKEDRLYVAEGKWAILVPKACMKYADGKDFLGSYRLRVKIMDNIQRQMAYSPPLNLDSNGHNYVLAASMVIDIEAFNGKQMLTLKDGYFIDIRFVGLPSSTSRFYAWKPNAFVPTSENKTTLSRKYSEVSFQADNGKWVNQYNYDYDFSDDTIAAIDFSQFYSGRKTAITQTTINGIKLEERLHTQGFNYLLNPDESKQVIDKFSEFRVARAGEKAKGPEQFSLLRGKALIGVRRFQGKNASQKAVFEMILFDKTESLFPELKPLREYPLAFNTSWPSKEVMDNFFRMHKFWDIDFVQKGLRYFLLLRSSEGLWEIELLQPKTRYLSDVKIAKREQIRFEKLLRQVISIHNQKNHAFEVYQLSQTNKLLTETYSAVLETSFPPKGLVRNAFKIRSLGRFAWAKPMPSDSILSLNIVIADQGLAPIDIAQLLVGFRKPDAIQVLQPIASQQKNREFSVLLDPARVLFFAARHSDGTVYCLGGDAFRKMEIKNHTLFYLPLGAIEDQLFTDESIRKILGIPKNRIGQ